MPYSGLSRDVGSKLSGLHVLEDVSRIERFQGVT